MITLYEVIVGTISGHPDDNRGSRTRIPTDLDRTIRVVSGVKKSTSPT